MIGCKITPFCGQLSAPRHAGGCGEHLLCGVARFQTEDDTRKRERHLLPLLANSRSSQHPASSSVPPPKADSRPPPPTGSELPSAAATTLPKRPRRRYPTTARLVPIHVLNAVPGRPVGTRWRTVIKRGWREAGIRGTRDEQITLAVLHECCTESPAMDGNARDSAGFHGTDWQSADKQMARRVAGQVVDFPWVLFGCGGRI